MNGIRRILIINGKGGCGKSTIATNLAVSYCQRGYRTALMDYDSQASSTDWAELRTQSPDPRANLQVVPMHSRVGMYQTRAFKQQLPADITRIIIDTPSGARERDIDALIKQCDVILIPMLSAPLDIRSGSRFIAELLTHRGYRANPRAIGVVANRLHHDTASQQKLLHALECLNVPCVANFADSALYGRAAEDGAGITELHLHDDASRIEANKWMQLIDWVEAQPRRAERIPAPPGATTSPTRTSPVRGRGSVKPADRPQHRDRS